MGPLISTWPYLACLGLSVLCTTLLGGQLGFGLAPLWLLVLGCGGLWCRWRRRSLSRRWLLALGLVASAQLLLHLLAVNLAMVRLQLSARLLLAESLELYLAVNGLFLFWYWFFDAPLRNRSDGGIPIGVLFPEEDLEERLLGQRRWLPGWFDYLFFTVIASNSLGPPDGHAVVGRSLKTVQMLHSLAMISVFILILARAINTLG
jgi:hypothetical protein